MTLRRAAVLMLLACGLTGCGPKPTPGGPGGDSGKLDGVWMITKVEMPPSVPPPPAEELNKYVATVQGNMITARRQGDSKPQHVVFEIDTKVNPNVITITQSDEKGDTSPMKVPSTAFGGKVSESTVERSKVKGIISIDGDTAKLAICPAPDAPIPTEFAPKEPATKEWKPDSKPADTAPVIVVHFARQKEAPAWVNEPVQTPATKTSPTMVRTFPTTSTPPSAPKGK